MHVHISKPNTTSQHDQKNGGAADNTGGFQRQRRMKLETQDSQVGESTCLPRLSKSETGRDERAIRDPSVSRHGVLPAMQAALVGDVAFPHSALRRRSRSVDGRRANVGCRPKAAVRPIAWGCEADNALSRNAAILAVLCASLSQAGLAR
jgi:hypothetical protein